ncbi:MAG: cytochrome-c peroxidase [Crocinitomicaceae bacterium]|nr:cytochrome-c peroxidase [Crocinitomicaceae bacterium]
MKWIVYILIAAVFLLSCKKEVAETVDTPSVVNKEQPIINTPPGFPEIPASIIEQVTPARVALGKKLFFDPILSRTGKISCGSCHKRELAFTDGQKFSEGVDGRLGFRNSPTLVNLLWSPIFMWDGGPQTLEAQVRLPLENHDEMDLNIVEVISRLNQNAEYVELFQAAFEQAPGPIRLAEAIAIYERTLISANSNFDKFEYQGNKQALSSLELKGRSLFNSEKFQCKQCHVPPLFTNYEFINNGTFIPGQDSGRYRVTLHFPDKGKFKVPSLRNIDITSPYMHDGRFTTLEEVVDFYASGGAGFSTQDMRITQKDITSDERQALVAFLKSLTDQEFLQKK